MKAKRPTVVLDTNVLIVSLLPKFKYHWIFEALLNDRFRLVVSNEILTEYEEQLCMRYGLDTSERHLGFLLMLPNVHLIDPHFNWELITVDVDDNKFVDCAIAANADHLVTEDRHFQVLRDVPFPKVDVLGIAEFQRLLGV